MIAHTSVAVKDYAKSKELYAKMLAPLGYVIQMDVPQYKATGYAANGAMDFWIGESDKQGGVHVAFKAEDKETVDAFHVAARAAGAKDNGAPGYRKEYAPGYYGAFVHDFDGNNIEAVWMDPSPPVEPPVAPPMSTAVKEVSPQPISTTPVPPVAETVAPIPLPEVSVPPAPPVSTVTEPSAPVPPAPPAV